MLARRVANVLAKVEERLGEPRRNVDGVRGGSCATPVRTTRRSARARSSAERVPAPWRRAMPAVQLREHRAVTSRTPCGSSLSQQGCKATSARRGRRRRWPRVMVDRNDDAFPAVPAARRPLTIGAARVPPLVRASAHRRLRLPRHRRAEPHHDGHRHRDARVPGDGRRIARAGGDRRGRRRPVRRVVAPVPSAALARRVSRGAGDLRRLPHLRAIRRRRRRSEFADAPAGCTIDVRCRTCGKEWTIADVITPSRTARFAARALAPQPTWRCRNCSVRSRASFAAAASYEPR